MNAQSPGLLTVVQRHDYERLYAHGYRWVSFQHWYRGPRGSIDSGEWNLAQPRAAGMEAGVWACVYEGEVFFTVGKNAAERAVTLGASHLIMDVEYALNGTRPGGARPLIDGCRAGGWTGPVHLSTFGAPDKAPDGSFWDYGQDLDSFRQTGGIVMPQAYTNMHPPYNPGDSAAYYESKGVPRDRLNLTIWPNGSLPASEWVAELQAAGLGPAVSIFLPEQTTDGDFTTLEAITKAPVPQPDPPEVLMEKLNLANTGVNAALGHVEELFDAAGIPEPDGLDALKAYLLALGAKVNELVDAVNASRA